MIVKYEGVDFISKADMRRLRRILNARHKTAVEMTGCLGPYADEARQELKKEQAFVHYCMRVLERANNS